MSATIEKTRLSNTTQGVVLTDEQAKALGELEAWVNSARPSFVLFGWAGTGKTTVISRFIQDHTAAKVVALTGKAASVLRGKSGLPASTIHSLIYQLIEVVERKGEPPKLRFARRYGPGEMRGTIVVIDECSMVDERMAGDIFQTGARIIAAGDPGQLPPVYGERHFNEPDRTLQQIHRQAMESAVIRQAHRVRVGNGYAADGEAFRVVSRITDETLAAADAILVWRNVTRTKLNNRMRAMRGLSGYPRRGEPVLCLQNVHSCGLYNGGVYVLAADFLPKSPSIRLIVEGTEIEVPYVRFEGEPEPEPQTDDWGRPRKFTSRFDYGYALTVHKAQGSEWSDVLLVDEYPQAREQRREWLYTGITRAADEITVVRGGFA